MKTKLMARMFEKVKVGKDDINERVDVEEVAKFKKL